MDRKHCFVARCRLSLEHLEDRTVPSIFTPAQIQQAYGFNQITFSTSSGRVTGNGAGQTIAIVDAYADPNIVTDLQTFDRKFGIADPPSFTVVQQAGTVANASWTSEIALDVEWAHAIAPGARIVLGEAKSNNLSDLVSEADTVAAMPGVSVVAMSWSANEWASETAFDSSFLTPKGHQGVTFVASSGDNGAQATWPASSPNVLSVGGTSLYSYSNGSYENESGWSLSGGGVSLYESKPGYQGDVSTGSNMRTTPDVSFDANASTGLYVYSSYGGGGWFEVGGTSAGTPQWAGLIAIADQGRTLAGKPTLDGASQTLYAIYKMAQTSETTYFHDVTTGNNGYAAKPGYDYVTGNGSPVANMVVAGLVAWNGTGITGSLGSTTSALTLQQQVGKTSDVSSPITLEGGSSPFLAPTPALANSSTPSIASSSINFSISDASTMLALAQKRQTNTAKASSTYLPVENASASLDAFPTDFIAFDVNWTVDLKVGGTEESGPRDEATIEDDISISCEF